MNGKNFSNKKKRIVGITDDMEEMVRGTFSSFYIFLVRDPVITSGMLAMVAICAAKSL